MEKCAIFFLLVDFECDVDDIQISTGYECCSIGDVIVHVTSNSNKLIKYSTSQNRYEDVEIDIDGMVAHTVHFDGERIWITGDKPIIYIMDKNLEHVIKRIELPEKYYKKNELVWKYCFSMGEIVGEYIFYAPLYYKAVVRVDLKTCKIEIILPVAEQLYSWGMNYVADNCMHLNLMKDENEHWSYFINYEGKILEKDVFKLSNWDSYCRANPILQESNFISLKLMLMGL